MRILFFGLFLALSCHMHACLPMSSTTETRALTVAWCRASLAGKSKSDRELLDPLFEATGVAPQPENCANLVAAAASLESVDVRAHGPLAPSPSGGRNSDIIS